MDKHAQLITDFLEFHKKQFCLLVNFDPKWPNISVNALTLYERNEAISTFLNFRDNADATEDHT